MLIILLSWLLITAVVYPLGFIFNEWLSKQVSAQAARDTNITFVCLSGMMVTTVLSTILAFFIPLGLVANCIVLILSISAVLLRKMDLLNSIRKNYTDLRSTSPIVILMFVTFTFTIANLSYEPSSHYDDGLYYSTSIKWLQDYGTIKGIANLNPRIGFNSSWHILQALFGFSFLNAGLFNDLNGLIYLYIFIYSLGGLNKLIKKQSSFAVLLQALFFVPALAFHYGASSDLALFNINYLGSSTPDLPVSMMLWFVFVLFTVQKDKDFAGASFLDLLILVYTVWIITMKLSAAPVLLLSVFILYKVFKLKEYRNAITLCGLCIVIISPWLLRNVFLTGYLIFPFSAIDIFPVDWKVRIETVKWFENAIKAFAVGTDINVPFRLKINTWFLSWFNRQNYINHVLSFTSVLATLVYTVIALVTLTIRRRESKIHPIINQRFIITNLTLIISIIFWFIKSPDFRFGYGFICIYCLIFICFVLTYFLEINITYIRFPYYLFIAYLAIFHYASTWSWKAFGNFPLAYRLPKETYVRIVNGIRVTIVRHDDSWNAQVPVANESEFNFSNSLPRGKTILSGFKPNTKKPISK